MKTGKVDQTIGGNEKIGEEARDNIEVSDEDANNCHTEHKNVTSDWIIILATSFAKHFQTRIQFILGQGLEDPATKIQ